MLKRLFSTFILLFFATSLVAQEGDVSFDQFFEELLKEIEKETAAQKEREATPTRPDPLAPAPLTTTTPTEVSFGRREDFLRPYTPGPEVKKPKLSPFKEESLESYLRTLRTNLEELNQAIGALDVFERKQFKNTEKTLNAVIEVIGRLLSKRIYERALFDKGFNHVRRNIIDLEPVISGAIAEIARREDDYSHVIKNIRGVITHDLPALEQELKKVFTFSQKSVEEKMQMRKQLTKSAEEYLKRLEARRPVPYYPTYSQRRDYDSQHRRGPRGTGYAHHDYGRPVYDDYGFTPGRAPSAREQHRGLTPTKKEPSKKEKTEPKKAEELKDEIWTELKKNIPLLESAQEAAKRLRITEPARLGTELSIFNSRLESIDKNVAGTQKILGTNLNQKVSTLPFTQQETNATKPGRNHGWPEKRLETIEKEVTSIKKWVEELAKKSPQARFESIGKIRRKLAATRAIISMLIEHPEALATTTREPTFEQQAIPPAPPLPPQPHAAPRQPARPLKEELEEELLRREERRQRAREGALITTE